MRDKDCLKNRTDAGFPTEILNFEQTGGKTIVVAGFINGASMAGRQGMNTSLVCSARGATPLIHPGWC